MTSGLCFLCKSVQQIVYTDKMTQQKYCMKCVAQVDLPSEVLGMLFLYATIPFRVGDRVECRFYGKYEGKGVVDAIHFDIEHGGTPVYPSYHVVLEEKASDDLPDDNLYSEIGLKKLEDVGK